MDKVSAGTVAGALATAPMTATMVAAQRLLGAPQEEPLAPQEVTTNTAVSAGLHAANEPHVETSAWLAPHFAAGAAGGAMYAPFATWGPCSPALRGAGFGVAFWAANYLGLLPRLGLVEHPRRHSLPWNLAVVAAHVVWGAALGVMVDRLSVHQKLDGRDDRAGKPGPTVEQAGGRHVPQPAVGPGIPGPS